MLTKRNAIKRVRLFLAECGKLPFKIDKAILFGSVAKGKATKDSDIDLALFSKKFTNDIFYNLDLIGKINIRYPDIDVHTYPAKQFNSNGILIEQIKKTGIELTF